MPIDQNMVLTHTERVHNSIAEDASAVSAIAASWRRSMLHYGLSPDQAKSENQLSAQELKLIRERMELLLHVARPILEQLFRTVGRSGCCVILSDVQGVVLDRLSNVGDDLSFDGWNLRMGSVWSEQQQGTNGIGTCVNEERTVLIHKDQHFSSHNIGMTCMGSPIFDVNGKLMAVLDVSSARDDFTFELAQLITSHVAETAYRIETEYFRASFTDATVIVADGFSPIGTPLLASNRDEFIVGANRAARRMLNLQDETFSSPIFINDLFTNGGARSGLDAAEKSEIHKAIARSNGNMSAAAKSLNVSRATFYRLMKKHNISRQ
ncbi:MAG: sigma-54-dependent Fis family transcriptional regulator [Rhizobiaceae bacterium]|nr:sigma-54-dependent Fis family transcriptional regulator [Rhizobiaceae bacterium]